MAGLYRELFDKIFRESLDVVAIVDPASGNIIRINNAVRYSLGYGIEDLAGKNLTVLFPKESSTKIQNWLAETKNHGPVFTEENLIRADGSTYPMELTTTLTPWDEGDAILVTFRDVVGERRNEEVLRRSEHLLENSFELITILGPDGVCLYASPSYKQILGYEREELLDQDFFGFIHPDDVERFRNRLDNSPPNYGSVHAFEYRFSHKDGFWVYLESLAKTLPDESGEVKTLINSRDVTELKQAIKALCESEERYRDLLENAMDVIITLSAEGTIVSLNPAFEAITGWPSEEWVGKYFSSIIHPEDRPKAMEHFHKALKGERLTVFELRVLSKSGEFLDWEFTASPQIRPRNLVSALCIARDITKRNLAEEELRKSQAKYVDLFENASDMIFTFDLAGNFTSANRVAYTTLGYKIDEIRSVSLKDILTPESFRTALDMLQNAIIRKSDLPELQPWELEAVKKDGGKISVEVRTRLIREGNQIVGVQGIARDVTERKKMQEEILKAQKLESLGVLAGGIAHDFNNLLTSILGNISLAKMYASPGDKGYKRLSEAEKACIRTRDLTQQLLTFSRGGAPVKKVVSSLGEIIKDSASFAVSGSKVKCEFVIEEKLWPVEVDQGQISQVMNNLVINADQAMPKGGVIKIKVENAVLEKDETPHLMPGRYVKITIEDSGVGIPEELLTRIFDPYFTTKQRGSGLGLATVYSIIKNHDGYVGVESRLGVGTRFKVYIPAKEGGASTESEAQESLKRGKGRVLVVDDVDIVRETAGEILSHLGYEVDYAKNGNEVIEKYARSGENGKPIDTIIIDLNVPGEIGGKEAIQKLLDKYPGVKAIVSTGYSNDPILSDYGKYGFRGVISKPYKIEELGDIVYEVINGN